MVDRKQQDAARVREQLVRMRQAAVRRGGAGGVDPGHRALSAWQAARLSRTHEDFLTNLRFRPAMVFFLEELYGPKDFSRRDQDLQRATPIMIRALPAELLNTLAMALELHALSFELDDAMVSLLEAGQVPITESRYASAFRELDNRPQREHQLGLIHDLGVSLHGAVRMPFVHSALKLARGPAKLAGFGDLQGFLEQGFVAFKHVGGSRQFLDTIVHREQRILERLFAAEAEPFRLDE